MSYIDENHVDIAFLQETWLTGGDANVYVEMEEYGFKVHKYMREKCRGGGLAVLYKKNLLINQTILKPELNFESFENIVCTFKSNNQSLIMVNIYRPPYSDRNPFTTKKFLED